MNAQQTPPDRPKWKSPAEALSDLKSSYKQLNSQTLSVVEMVVASNSLSKKDSQTLFDECRSLQSELQPLTKSLKQLRTAASKILVEARKKAPSGAQQRAYKDGDIISLETGIFQILKDGKWVTFTPAEPKQESTPDS